MLHLTIIITTIITPTAAALAIISLLLLLFLLTYRKIHQNVKMQYLQYVNPSMQTVLHVNSMRRYLIQIHCRREES